MKRATAKQARKITDIISKPSEALQAMVDGLRTQSKRKDFIIDMSTYGAIETMGRKRICVGCAATCAVQQLAGENLTKKWIGNTFDHADAFGFDRNQTSEFEYSIDSARGGDLFRLFSFFDLANEYDSEVHDGYFHVRTENWRDKLPKVEAHIKKLQSLGF